MSVCVLLILFLVNNFVNCSNGLPLCHFHCTLCGLLYPFCRSRFTHFSLLLLLYYISLSLFGAACTATANCVRISKFNSANTSSVLTFLFFFVATRCDSIEFFAFTFLTSGFGVGVGIDFFAQKTDTCWCTCKPPDGVYFDNQIEG